MALDQPATAAVNAAAFFVDSDRCPFLIGHAPHGHTFAVNILTPAVPAPDFNREVMEVIPTILSVISVILSLCPMHVGRCLLGFMRCAARLVRPHGAISCFAARVDVREASRSAGVPCRCFRSSPRYVAGVALIPVPLWGTRLLRQVWHRTVPAQVGSARVASAPSHAHGTRGKFGNGRVIAHVTQVSAPSSATFS